MNPSKLYFTDSRRHWGTDTFTSALKRELHALKPGTLPLAHGTTHGGMIDDADIKASIIRCQRNADSIWVQAGIFFNEIVGGCSCGDEPYSINAYCEIQVSLDLSTAQVQFSPL